MNRNGWVGHRAKIGNSGHWVQHIENACCPQPSFFREANSYFLHSTLLNKISYLFSFVSFFSLLHSLVSSIKPTDLAHTVLCCAWSRYQQCLLTLTLTLTRIWCGGWIIIKTKEIALDLFCCVMCVCVSERECVCMCVCMLRERI